LSLQSCVNSARKSQDNSIDETDIALFRSWQKLDRAFNCCSQNIWDESYKAQHEAVMFVRTKKGAFQYAYIINHPNPAKIRGAKRVNVAALSGNATLAHITPVYRIDYLAPDQFARIGNFDFEFAIGGSDVFAVSYQKRTAKKIRKALEDDDGYQEPGDNSFADVASDDWILFLAHEIFHRRQFKRWANFENNQDLDTYNFSIHNIALILLEQNILKKGLRGQIDAPLALIEYAAVRNHRTTLYGTQIMTLDSTQEIYEGTSRYIEHRFGALISNEDFNNDNFAEQIESDEEIYPELDVKDTLGFGRFYASGAAVAALLDKTKIDWKDRVMAGQNFTQIIDQHYGKDKQEQILALAKARHDFSTYNRKAAQYFALLK